MNKIVFAAFLAVLCMAAIHGAEAQSNGQQEKTKVEKVEQLEDDETSFDHKKEIRELITILEEMEQNEDYARNMWNIFNPILFLLGKSTLAATG